MDEVVEIREGWRAHVRKDEIAIIHPRGGLHMAQLPEIAMVHEIIALRAALVEAMHQAVDFDGLKLSEIGPQHWYTQAAAILTTKEQP